MLDNPYFLKYFFSEIELWCPSGSTHPLDVEPHLEDGLLPDAVGHVEAVAPAEEVVLLQGPGDRGTGGETEGQLEHKSDRWGFKFRGLLRIWKHFLLGPVPRS